MYTRVFKWPLWTDFQTFKDSHQGQLCGVLGHTNVTPRQFVMGRKFSVRAVFWMSSFVNYDRNYLASPMFLLWWTGPYKNHTATGAYESLFLGQLISLCVSNTSITRLSATPVCQLNSEWMTQCVRLNMSDYILKEALNKSNNFRLVKMPLSSSKIASIE